MSARCTTCDAYMPGLVQYYVGMEKEKWMGHFTTLKTLVTKSI
jgi:hypothetical protein